MKLKELFKDITIKAVKGNDDVEITGVNIDSRRIKEGHLFIAMKGTQVDGHKFIPKAIEYGESCLGQTVEESLLSVAIVLESLVIVEVVACEVGEYASCEAQSSDTLLCYGV